MPATSPFGDVFVEPLFTEHTVPGEDPLRPLFTLLVPVHIDGRSTTIAATSRAYRGIR